MDLLIIQGVNRIMKKLLLLLLLTTSFSTFGLSIVEKERCLPSSLIEAEIKLFEAELGQ